MIAAYGLLPVRRYTGAEAALRNRLAAARCAIAAATLGIDENVELVLEATLPRYALVLEYSCGYGSLQVGLDLGASFPEYAAQLVAAAAPNEEEVPAWLDWLFSPWVERFERHLGITLTLKAACLDAAVVEESLALRLCLSNGDQAHIALSGTALPHIRCEEWLLIEPRPRAFEWLSVVVSIVLDAGPLSIRKIDRLGVGAVLWLPWSGFKLHFGHLLKPIRLSASWNNKEHVMDLSVKPLADPLASGLIDSGAEEGVLSLEELVLHVDVILERRLVSLGELRDLQTGALFALERPLAGRAVDLRCNGHLFARGEIASVDERIAVLINECVGRK